MPPAKVEPGRDAGMAARAGKLNVVFALTSILMLVVFSWMIWADYDREWKKHQLEFTRLEVTRTEEEIQKALGKVDAKRRQELEGKLVQAKQEAAARRKEIDQAEDELNKLDGEWYRVDQDYRFTKAKIDVARFNYEESTETHRGSAEKRKKELDDLEQRWKELRADLEDVEGRRAAGRAKLDGLQKTKLDAEALEKELYTDRDRLEERLHKIQPGFVSFVRNMPVLDLANPSLKVNQILPANLTDDVVFTGTPKVDRCTTCHLGIDKKGYEKAPQPYTTHPNLELFVSGPHPIDRIGCTACHQGRGRATGFVNAVHTPSTAEQEKAWGKYTHSDTYHRLHYWDLPMMAKGQTEAQCVKCHQGMVDVPKADRLNTGTLLVERYGCHGCHKIKGWEGLRKVAPDLTKILTKTNEEWILRWVEEPKAFRNTRMPQVWNVRPDETPEQLKRNDVEIAAVVSYLAEKSGRDAYPAPPAGDLDAGRQAFETIGCLGCHRVGDDKRGLEKFWAASYRTHGPNLEGTGSKVNAGWLYAWIRDPKSYWHDTRMPDLRLSDKEAADITAYLMSLKKDEFLARPRPAVDAAIRDGIAREHLLGANLAVKEADKKLASMDDRQRTLFVGEKTIGRYGCFGCHNISGFEKTSPIGVELTEEGSKLVERLDFGFEHDIPHTLPGWAKRKLEEPRIFDRGKVKKPEELLRMPKFWVSGEEADVIVTTVMSLTKEQVPLAAQAQLSADGRYAERALRLVRDYNCRGCHQVGDHGGSIREVVKSQLEASGGDPSSALGLSPPLLYNANARIGEGARVKSDWLHAFLNDPSNKIRPWFTLRMPTFHFTEDQLNTLTRGFAAQDKVPFPVEPLPVIDTAQVAAGHDLFDRWQCIKCHVVAGKLPNQDPANMAPDLALVPVRLRADWLDDWLADPQKIQPGTRMPSNFPKNPKENAFPEILGGDQAKQIEAVRAYLLTLGPGGPKPSPAPPAAPSAVGTTPTAGAGSSR
jgi:mono/diheme cytochrome c family protein/predicted  nucleic acid-binding Zn-ribbon protein